MGKRGLLFGVMFGLALIGQQAAFAQFHGVAVVLNTPLDAANPYHVLVGQIPLKSGMTQGKVYKDSKGAQAIPLANLDASVTRKAATGDVTLSVTDWLKVSKGEAFILFPQSVLADAYKSAFSKPVPQSPKFYYWRADKGWLPIDPSNVTPVTTKDGVAYCIRIQDWPLDDLLVACI
jgi:hypothetical protein